MAKPRWRKHNAWSAYHGLAEGRHSDRVKISCPCGSVLRADLAGMPERAAMRDTCSCGRQYEVALQVQMREPGERGQ